MSEATERHRESRERAKERIHFGVLWVRRLTSNVIMINQNKTRMMCMHTFPFKIVIGHAICCSKWFYVFGFYYRYNVELWHTFKSIAWQKSSFIFRLFVYCIHHIHQEKYMNLLPSSASWWNLMKERLGN